jgi:hypothetical protein
MKYKNITKIDLELPNIGIVKAGEVIELPKGLNNANFKVVEEEIKKINK